MLFSSLVICGGFLLLGILAVIGVVIWRRSREGAEPLPPPPPPYVEPVTQTEDEPELAPFPTRVAASPPMQVEAVPITTDGVPPQERDELPTQIDLQPPLKIVDTLWRVVVAAGVEVGKSYPLHGQVRVGREADNDIVLAGDQKASRHHALFQLKENTLEVFDLNSSNGTFVNSRRVSNHVLIHDDVITIGHHRIKYLDPEARRRATLEGAEFADTIIMKSLDDMRKILAQESTEMLPSVSEHLPTAGLQS